VPALGLLLSCLLGCHGGPHIPRGDATSITLERAEPHRQIQLVNASHPDFQSNGPRRAPIKRVTEDEMEDLLDELDRQGFRDTAYPLPSVEPMQAQTSLFRLLITVDNQSFAYVVPRGPSPQALEKYRQFSAPIQQTFNQTVDFRWAGEIRDSSHFLKSQRLLQQQNQRNEQTGQERR
jgi:hypothetical protein